MTQPLSREIYNPVQRDRIVFLKTAGETDGEFTLFDMEVAPGGGNALHFHTTFSERFMVDEGVLGAQVGKRRLSLPAGDSELVPARVVHRWFNFTASPATVRVELRPGNEGFEQALRIAYGLARDGLTNKRGLPKSMLQMAFLVDLSDTRLAGPMRALNPMFIRLARVARRRGIDADLKRQYCT
jgi:mannose-6-phosphate isomerase-like protein (cupin superfamily)